MNLRKEQKDREIVDEIDRPILPLIIQLNRVGLRTKWCCCGFPYKDEKTQKTHANQPFVVFHPPAPTDHSLNAFFTLGRTVAMGYWELRPYYNGEWHMMGKSSESKFYRRSDDGPGLHDYESALINIQSLTKVISTWPGVKEDEVTIVDGNTNYDKMTNNEWQIIPAKESVIKVKEHEPAKIINKKDSTRQKS